MRRFIVFTLALYLLGLATPAMARTLHIRADGFSDVPTIQDAFNAAEPGDDILVGPGSFYEADILSQPGVLLHSEAGAAFTRIDATGGMYGVYGESSGAPWIDGFTIFGSSNATIAVLDGGSQSIANCVVYGGGAGIYARYYTGVIANVTAVAGDGAIYSGSGISLSHSFPILHNCICAFN